MNVNAVKKIENSIIQSIEFEKTNQSSIFDVHNNGIVDEGDFSQKDLENDFVKKFLIEFLNKKWSVDIENKISNVIKSLNKENLETNNGKYKISLQDNVLIIKNKGRKTEINIDKDATVTKDDLQNLIKILASFTEDEMNDFTKEIRGIRLAENISMGGVGFFDIDSDTIELSVNDEKSGLNKYTLVHELGHAVSVLRRNSDSTDYKYAYDFEIKERFKNIEGINILLANLKKDFGEHECLKNFDMLYKEFSLYKQEGKTEHSSEILFKQLELSEDKEIKNLIEILTDPVEYINKIGFFEKGTEVSEEDALWIITCSNAAFRGVLGIDFLLQQLREKYGTTDENKAKYGDGYALTNINEFFAEYYLYTKEQQTKHHSENLFKELEKSDDKEIIDLLKIMKSHVKISKKEDKLRKIN